MANIERVRYSAKLFFVFLKKRLHFRPKKPENRRLKRGSRAFPKQIVLV